MTSGNVMPSPFSEVSDNRALLQNAIEKGEFVPYYQPMICANTGLIAGAEALVRWEHQTLGLIMPGAFLPQVEQHSLLIPMTISLLDRIKQDLLSIAEKLPEGFNVSMNITADMLLDEAFCRRLAHGISELHNYDIIFTIEIIESHQQTTLNNIKDKIGQFRDLGAMIALDDFGTGNSNFSSLTKIKPDFIKIDRGFVAGIGNNKSCEAIIHAITDISNTLNLSLISEGVEEQEQISYLKELGVEFFQGFYFSKALSHQNFLTYLNKVNHS